MSFTAFSLGDCSLADQSIQQPIQQSINQSINPSILPELVRFCQPKTARTHAPKPNPAIKSTPVVPVLAMVATLASSWPYRFLRENQVTKHNW